MAGREHDRFLSMTITIDIAPEKEKKLEERAKSNGQADVAEYIQKLIDRDLMRLPSSLSEAERAADDRRLEAHIVSLGSPTGIDNESIESDLAREYGDDHRDLYHK